MIALGICLLGLSLYEMAGYTPDVSQFNLVWVGIVQGLGLGFVFVPLSTVTFATLAPHFRVQGTSLFSLMRHIGSSNRLRSEERRVGNVCGRTGRTRWSPDH